MFLSSWWHFLEGVMMNVSDPQRELNGCIGHTKSYRDITLLGNAFLRAA